MNNKLLSALLLLLCTVSCRKEPLPQYSGTPIVFTDSKVETKTAGIITTGSLTNMGIFGYHTGTQTFTEAAAPNFMWNQIAAKNGDSWSYSPLKYWPSGKNYLSFFAYSPIASDQNGIAPSANDASGRPTFFIKVPREARFQPDLVLSRPKLNLTSADASSAIGFEFMHAMSKVRFSSDGLNIISISIKGAANQGTTVMTGDNNSNSIAWYRRTVGENSEFTITTSDMEYEIDPTSGHGESTSLGTLMMIPQEAVTVTVTVVYQKFTQPNPITTIEKGITMNWVMGGSVKYQITLTEESKLSIELIVEQGNDNNWIDHNFDSETIGGTN